MYKSNGAYPYDLSDDGGSVRSSTFSLDERSSQSSSLSRPSGKFIYIQRKEYAESIIRQPGNFKYRVEHLFTCEVDGRDVRDLADCLEQLKLLDAKGMVWGQDMTLEVQDSSLQLTDIETKEELESLPLDSITELKAVLDTCIYNSMLTITVQDHVKRKTSIFLFQCEEVRAEHIKTDLERAIRLKGTGAGHRDDNRGNLGNIISISGGLQNSEPPTTDRGTPPDHPSSQWNDPDYDENGSLPPPREESEHQPEPESEPEPEPAPQEEEPPPPREYTETDRNVDILNHILNDVELFIGRVSEAAPKEDKKKKKKLMILKKSKKKKDVEGMPTPEEFASCLQKIKHGFNLLGILNGTINNPSAPEFVHTFFSTLEFLVPHCPPGMPPTIVSPLLTEQSIRLLSEEASAEEDQLWQSLGDAWNIPGSKWPDDEEVPPYVPEFSDGWEPPMVVKAPPKKSPVPNKVQRSLPKEEPDPQPEEREPQRELLREPPREPLREPPREPLRDLQREPQREPQITQLAQNSGNLQKPRVDELPPNYLRVMYDFTARNHRELSIMKGDVVQVLDQSRQWWKVRNSREEEGYVPNNVLQSMEERQVEEEEPQEVSSAPVLNKRSKPEDVKAWLEYKEFSKITVRCLGVLSGSLLLGMTREELKEVCPEEGGRVFFQLQAVKSALAIANESGRGP